MPNSMTFFKCVCLNRQSYWLPVTHMCAHTQRNWCYEIHSMCSAKTYAACTLLLMYSLRMCAHTHMPPYPLVKLLFTSANIDIYTCQRTSHGKSTVHFHVNQFKCCHETQSFTYSTVIRTPSQMYIFPFAQKVTCICCSARPYLQAKQTVSGRLWF